MIVMTFNTQHCLNFLTKEIDLDIMAKAIDRCSPDIVGLNEMYEAQVEKLSVLTGMPYFYFAHAIDCINGPYGNGILSKLPILHAETLPIPDPTERAYNGYYETRCILKADLAGGITALVTHMGLNPDELQNAVFAVTKTLTDKKCILMGDFNATPDNQMLAPIIERMIDTACAIPSSAYTFPSDAPERKIDYIFVSKDFKVCAAEIPPIVASDHRPHVAVVENL